LRKKPCETTIAAILNAQGIMPIAPTRPHGRWRQPASLITTALPLGYGPAAKLVALAGPLADRGLRLVFVGRGIALELAQRHSLLFHDVLEARSPEVISPALVRDAWGVLSVMDRELAPVAMDHGRPLFVLDSLLWMRDDVPPSWRSATHFWAQNFPRVSEVVADLELPVSIVGPIVATAPIPRSAAGDRLLVNLGGCATTDGSRELGIGYARFVVEGLLDSDLLERYHGRATLIAGQHIAVELASRFPACGLEFRSLSHEAALAELTQAAHLLTSPGLTMTLESFQLGTPTFFLPPQNYSQWCLLRTLRGLGLAPAALHWEDLMPGKQLAERLTENTRNPIVREAVIRHVASEPAAQRFAACLAQINEIDPRALAAGQQAFFRSLGENGVETIVSQLLETAASELVSCPT
jgi:hypothetical protein